MFIRTFSPWQLLRHLYGTEVFTEYCATRRLRFEQRRGKTMEREDFGRWQALLRGLSKKKVERVQLELAKVNEMAHADSIVQLLTAARGTRVPPEDVPGDTGIALWFLLRHPRLFHESFIKQEIGEPGAWWSISVPPGIAIAEPATRSEALAESLKDYFRRIEGTGKFCLVDMFPLNASCVFVAYLSDRLQLLDVFTEEGKYATQAARPAFAVLFVYQPEDGRVLLKTRLRGADRVLSLFQMFGKTVLDVKIDGGALAPLYRLDVFKRKFDPPPDAEDMEMVRVRSLHLVYPERFGRRRVKLETLPGDRQFAILDLLNAHGGGESVLDQLDVLYAELQVRLRVEGRSMSYLIRLWPERCSLNHTALGKRFHACLQRWGIAHVV